ncbi:MAG: hypothetical protein GXP49_15030 [Deltaproteobacteria bacterium]|nr:hypothetical protein [Deltaproteobacteria bacterium]
MEICGDFIDQDCDNKDLACSCPDNDSDGHKDFACGGDDCDDTRADIHPGATEICGDFVDQDCDGKDLACKSDEIEMIGDIALGQSIYADMKGDSAGHGYGFTGYNSTEVTVLLITTNGLKAGLALQGPAAGGDWGDELISAEDPGSGRLELDNIAIPKMGRYRIVIYNRSHTAGGYQLVLKCSKGCAINTCPSRTDFAPPPVGKKLKLIRDQELAVTDTQSDALYIDYYGQTGADYLGSGSTDKIDAIDLASFDPGRGNSQESAVVLLNQDGFGGVVDVVPPAPDDQIQGLYGIPGDSQAVGMVAADWDGDGDDQLFVLRQDGSIMGVDLSKDAYCWNIDASLDDVEKVKSITAADFDMDTLEELAVLYHGHDGDRIAILDMDAQGKAHVTNTLSLDVNGMVLAAGNLDDKGGVDIAIGVEGGLFSRDSIQVYGYKPGGFYPIVKSFTTPDGVRDMTMYDPVHEGRDRLALLDKSGKIEVLTPCNGDLCTLEQLELSRSDDAKFVTAADLDGDTPYLELKSGPYPTKGAVVPAVVLVFTPAYQGINTDWPTTVGFGRSTAHGEDLYDETVTLHSDVSYGLNGEIPGLFEAGVKTKVSRAVSQRVADFITYKKSLSYSLMQAYPGYLSKGGVVFSWTCYDSYLYRLWDPSKILKGNAQDENVAINVPVYIGDVAWDVARYNDNAEMLGVKPISINIDPGDPSSYPQSPVDLRGDPVAEEDFVTPDPLKVTVSDYAVVDWEYVLGEEVTHEESLSIGIDAEAELKVGPATFGASVGIEGESAHTIVAGRETKFDGTVGPLFDLPDTGIDEYFNYYYEFTPFVYRETDKEGGYFVQSFYINALGPGYK